jgi:hypothetical protein
MVEFVSNTIYLGVFVGSYVFATIVLIGDIDFKCSRAFPLNFIVWFVQSICMSYISCFVAIKMNSYLVLSMLLVMLIVTIVNAIFGMCDCSRLGSCLFSKKNCGRIGSILMITLVFAAMIAPSEEFNFPGKMPARYGAKQKYAKFTFILILVSWAVFTMIF